MKPSCAGHNIMCKYGVRQSFIMDVKKKYQNTMLVASFVPVYDEILRNLFSLLKKKKMQSFW